MDEHNNGDVEQPPFRRRSTDHITASWHIGKEVPLALIAVVLVQTAGGVWWASNLTSKVDAALETLREYKAERYTKEDARRDREFVLQIIEPLRLRDADLERRILTIERQHEPQAPYSSKQP